MIRKEMHFYRREWVLGIDPGFVVRILDIKVLALVAERNNVRDLNVK